MRYLGLTGISQAEQPEDIRDYFDPGTVIPGLPIVRVHRMASVKT